MALSYTWHLAHQFVLNTPSPIYACSKSSIINSCQQIGGMRNYHTGHELAEHSCRYIPILNYVCLGVWNTFGLAWNVNGVGGALTCTGVVGAGEPCVIASSSFTCSTSCFWNIPGTKYQTSNTLEQALIPSTGTRWRVWLKCMVPNTGHTFRTFVAICMSS